MMASGRRWIRDAWKFLAIVLATVGLLAGLNELPRVFGGEPRGVIAYESVSAVQSRYRVSLWRPRALPRGWSPQPARVRVAVAAPRWVEMRFERRSGSGLRVCQTVGTAAAGAVPPPVLLDEAEVLQADPVVIGGREATIRRLLLASGAIVHEVWWREDGRQVMFRLEGSVEDVMAVGRSAFGEVR
jgi:hypothetical protein